MFRAVILLVLSLLILIPECSPASTIDLSGAIDDSGVAAFSIDATFPPSEGRPVCLNLSGDVDTVVVKDRSGLILGSSVRKQGNASLICAAVPYDFLEFDIVSDSFTSKNGSEWDFDLVLGFSENVSGLNASMGFPKGTLLKSTNGAIGGNGDSLKAVWSGKGMSPGKTAHLRAGYTISDSTPIPLDSLLFPSIVLLIVVAVLSFFLVWKAKEKPSKVPESHIQKQSEPVSDHGLGSNSVFKILDETDKEIIREIFRQKGKTTQATLYLNTHIPKATLSRRMASLESRGLIVRSQKGNRNLVTLGEAFSR